MLACISLQGLGFKEAPSGAPSLEAEDMDLDIEDEVSLNAPSSWAGKVSLVMTEGRASSGASSF